MLSAGNIKENFRLYGRFLLQLKVRGGSRISLGVGRGGGSVNRNAYSLIWSAGDVYMWKLFICYLCFINCRFAHFRATILIVSSQCCTC